MNNWLPSMPLELPVKQKACGPRACQERVERNGGAHSSAVAAATFHHPPSAVSVVKHQRIVRRVMQAACSTRNLAAF